MFQTFVIFQKIEVKNVKNVQNHYLIFINFCGNCIFLAVYCVFHHVNLIFSGKITKILNIWTSYCASFLLQVYLRTWCSFLDFIRGRKVRSWSSFWQEVFSSSIYHFLSLTWIYKLLLSWINQNTSHCYTLNLRVLEQ